MAYVKLCGWSVITAGLVKVISRSLCNRLYTRETVMGIRTSP